MCGVLRDGIFYVGPASCLGFDVFQATCSDDVVSKTSRVNFEVIDAGES